MIPSNLVESAGRVFFTDLVGLWTTDGTAGGTRLVHEDAWNLAALDTILLFAGWDPDHGEELWTSDGTAAGTDLAADIGPGSAPGTTSAAAPSTTTFVVLCGPGRSS